MIPLHDNIPSRTWPVVNYGLIAACGLAFLVQLGQQDPDAMIERYGMIPARITHPGEPIETVRRVPVRTPFGFTYREVREPVAESAVPALLTMLTCIFLHGGWMHIIGNMWFLFIFGDNVEDRLGHLGYLVFYLFCGVAASAAHWLTGPSSTVPTIGASGAVAGVMGAYFLLYPHAKVMSIVPLFVVMQMVVLPAPLFLGIWFVLQFFQGAFAITSMEGAGVAWWAHVGGFVAGLAIAGVLVASHMARPPVERTFPNTERTTHYRIYPRRRS